MDIPSEGKHFKLIRNEDLYDVLHYLEYFMPESLKFHQTLKTYLEDHVWNFHFYVSKSWPRDPICLHFPGITAHENGEIFGSLGLFCPTNRTDCLYLLLDENILIDWTKPLYIHYIHSSIMDNIEYIYRSVGIVEKKCYGDFYIHYSPNDLSPIPPRFNEGEAHFKILEKKDAAVIHAYYPAKNIESLKLFETLVEKLPSYGIFINDELVAWMIQSYYGAMISMYTKSRFRLHGFGSFIAKYLSKLVAGRGYAPYVLVRSNNEVSRNLYERLGFTKLYTNVRGLLKPNSYR
ncbi:uncharacterized protein LOC135845914 [Planococcus citri]|uniref:uncharacterized protein LOC135845914 n=1 Tax=Planococcus citri TaxID=170843 RepID=UPI0031F74FB9